MAENKLFYGDCLDVLKELPAESVDLVYLDPPFNSNKNYNAIFASHDGKQSQAQITAFEDTWQWGEQAQLEYNSLLHNPESGTLGENILPALQAMMPQSDMMAYLVMMSARLVELKRVLKSTGSLYLHCDPTASHYLKIILDGLFSVKNFKNEIVWKRTTTHSDAKKTLGSVHDIILYYTKTDKYISNKIYKELDQKYVDSKYNKVDKDGRRYRTDNITAMGLSGGGYEYEWNGVKKIWRYPIGKMQSLHDSGRLKYTKNGTPEYIRYLDENKGIAIDDLWIDISPINSQAQERLGYPTQKPIELLERIIKISTNVGDIILDPFCGCGTAIHAAEKLGRKWIGIDITHLAVGLIKRRIHAAFPECNFDINGTPKDVDSARFLAESSGLEGRYQFQYWALSLIDGIASNDKKKGADSGSDGFIWAYNSPILDEPYKINISVKSGKIPANHIRELGGMIGKNKVEICLLLTLEEPSKKMVADALSYGEYEYPNGKKFPRIQILTIKELLEGKKPLFLDYGNGSAMPKKAKREEKKIKQGVLS